jgi:hypothetical protein
MCATPAFYGAAASTSLRINLPRKYASRGDFLYTALISISTRIYITNDADNINDWVHDYVIIRINHKN